MKRIEPLYQEILHHPFNQKLASGTLPLDTFKYYKAQDALYLKEFAKALAILATKMEDAETVDKILHFAIDCLKEAAPSSVAMEMNVANTGYTSFLLATAAYKTREELAAALLPCFWIYYRVAVDLKGSVKETNPYSAWFKTYYSEAYHHDVEWMIKISDQLANDSNEATVGKMLSAFVVATQWERAFWDAAYQKEAQIKSD